MGLSDRIKGLDRHRIEVPAAPEPVATGPVAAPDHFDRLIDDLHGTIAARYPKGCMEWVLAERRDIWTALCQLENQVDLAYIARDLPALREAADLLSRSYVKCFELFACRPPVVERQEALFS
jgi:hypothetical protein